MNGDTTKLRYIQNHVRIEYNENMHCGWNPGVEYNEWNYVWMMLIIIWNDSPKTNFLHMNVHVGLQSMMVSPV